MLSQFWKQSHDSKSLMGFFLEVFLRKVGRRTGSKHTANILLLTYFLKSLTTVKPCRVAVSEVSTLSLARLTLLSHTLNPLIKESGCVSLRAGGILHRETLLVGISIHVHSSVLKWEELAANDAIMLIWF